MFVETPSFPETIAWSAMGGPMWKTDIFDTQSGAEQRNENWAHYRAEFDVGLVNKSLVETRALLSFFNAIGRGRARGWRFKNVVNDDYYGTDEPLGTGDGADTTFQLLRRYTSGAETYDKLIFKPIVGTVTCKLAGVPTGAFTVNTTTGIVTFTSAPGVGVAVTASFQFDLPMRFNTDGFQCTRIDPDIFSWPSIPILETREIT
jgi:uncharacterized protein (TIGR02217 family)